MKDWLLLFLRVAAGVGLAYWAGHGKVFVEETREAYATVLRDGGVPGPYFMALLFGVVEFFGSLFIITGFFTRKAAGLMLVVGGVHGAIQVFMLDKQLSHLFFIDSEAGFGTGFFLIAFAIFLLLGAGNISFDAGRRKAAAD